MAVDMKNLRFLQLPLLGLVFSMAFTSFIIACTTFSDGSEDDVYCFAVDYEGTEYCTSTEAEATVEIITPTAVSATEPKTPTLNTVEAAPGYVLVSPLFGSSTYLIDKDGQPVHTWELTHLSGGVAYLLEDGNLLQTGIIEESDTFPEAVRTGGSGYLQLLDWDGEIVWEYAHITETQLQHHDIEPLPSGNILFIVYERFLKEEAVAAGRSLELFPEGRDEIWSEAILELDPSTDEIVWEWHVWDHLIQDNDPALPNFGDPAANPGRIDINYFVNFDENVGTHVEWLHANAIDYHEEKDQILFSPRQMNEFWIIDHSLTTEEAATEEGDLLFRWGNSEAFGVGRSDEQQLFFPHDPNWTDQGTIILFNNGAYNQREYSSVLEVAPALDNEGRYIMQDYEPTQASLAWEYQADPATSFFSFIMGAVQKLPNDNILIVDSYNKNAFEVDKSGDLVWQWFEPDSFYLFQANFYSIDYEPLQDRIN